jgi:4-amino-4-deoxy-L-arabinose transferase-like glycosyltransferase
MTASDPPAAATRAVRVVTLGLLAYWTTYVLVVPVTTRDSHNYNLARLLIADRGGLFGNPFWNSERQVAFPWSFDAVHYPFVLLGLGYALPSFLCFIGILVIVFRLVAERHGEAAGWWAALTLLSLPTVMYQASATKNDVAVVFGIACWFYALRQWLREGRSAHLALMALALGFAAGAKSSGWPPAVLCAAYSAWRIGWDRRRLGWFGLWCVLGVALLGSVEIYANNVLMFGHPLGSADLVRIHRNRDGLAGMAANVVRYVFGMMDLGPDFGVHSPRIRGWLTAGCRLALRLLGLTDVGYGDRFDDASFAVRNGNAEAGGDYGPLGAVAIVCALVVLGARWRRRDGLWTLAALGWLSLGLTAFTVGWLPWNNRFLLLPMGLFSLMTTLAVVGSPDTALARRAWAPLLGLLLVSSVIVPLYSLNKAPRDVYASIVARDAMVARESRGLLPVIVDVRSVPRRFGPSVVLLHAAPSAWTLPFLEMSRRDPALSVVPAPRLSEETLAAERRSAGDRALFVLSLRRRMSPSVERHLLAVSDYPREGDTTLWRVTGP